MTKRLVDYLIPSLGDDRRDDRPRPMPATGVVLLIWIDHERKLWTAPLGTPYPMVSMPIPSGWLEIDPGLET